MLLDARYSSDTLGLVWPLLLTLGIISVIASLLKGIGAASTGLSALTDLVSSQPQLMGTRQTAARALTEPIDLVGQQNLGLGILSNPLILQVTTIMAAVRLSLRGASRPPTQFITPRLAAGWAQLAAALPDGAFSMSELHLQPLPATSVGARMLVWFKGHSNLRPSAEYWTFVTSAPLGSLPAKCPNCGAPTASSSTTGICAYCNATLVAASVEGGGAAPVWLVDDISLSPPASAAA